jgi:hypothetical protein
MNNVKSVPDIGLKPVLKHAVVHNAMEVGSFVARPLGNVRLSLFYERRGKEEDSES